MAAVGIVDAKQAVQRVVGVEDDVARPGERSVDGGGVALGVVGEGGVLAGGADAVTAALPRKSPKIPRHTSRRVARFHFIRAP